MTKTGYYNFLFLSNTRKMIEYIFVIENCGKFAILLHFDTFLSLFAASWAIFYLGLEREIFVWVTNFYFWILGNVFRNNWNSSLPSWEFMKYVIFCPIFLSNNFCQVFKSLKDSLAKYVIFCHRKFAKSHICQMSNDIFAAHGKIFIWKLLARQ